LHQSISPNRNKTKPISPNESKIPEKKDKNKTYNRPSKTYDKIDEEENEKRSKIK
jgi:hypothetical protein